jgi:hypothetical protein
MCQIASLFFLQRLKGSMSGDTCDFNNIEMQAVIKFFFLHSKAPKEMQGNMHQSMTPLKTGWPSLNLVIFPPVMHLVLENPKQ